MTKTKTKQCIEKIEADFDGQTASVSWVIGADRFHVWIRKGTAEDVVYKNSVAKHGELGHYNTRQLDRSTSRITAAMFAEVWETVERDDLIGKAKVARGEQIKREVELTALKGQKDQIEQTVLNLFRNGAIARIAGYTAEYAKVTDAILLLELEA